MDRTISYRLHKSVAWLGIDRPEKRNAINSQMLADLDQAIEKAQGEASAMVIFGHGACFCAGLDLVEHRQRDPMEAFAISRAWHRVFERLRRGPVPAIAALHGAVIGGGLELAAACHLRISDTTATFALPEARHGIYVGGGASVNVAGLIGATRMMDMMLTGRTLDAPKAEQVGLVQYLVSEGNALSFAEGLAAKIVQVPSATVLGILQALPRIQGMSAEDGLFVESMMTALSQSTPDAALRLAAFEKNRLAATPERVVDAQEDIP